TQRIAIRVGSVENEGVVRREADEGRLEIAEYGLATVSIKFDEPCVKVVDVTTFVGVNDAQYASAEFA
ncbi:MAG: hypothetical protein AAFQ17_04290, partial [Pseudomonadota bacterium]